MRTIDLTKTYERVGNATAVFTLAGGGACSATGLYEASYLEVSVGRRGVEAQRAVFTCASVPVSDPAAGLKVAEGDTVSIACLDASPVLFEVRDPQPDHNGSVSFDLTEQL